MAVAKSIVWVVGSLALIGVVAFVALGWWSHNGASSGAGMAMQNGVMRLAPCGQQPNCVCSEYSDSDRYIEPLELPAASGQWPQIRQAVVDLGGVIVEENDDYLRATFTSSMFRFVDDFELRAEDNIVHLRSASRVGYSDAGVNLKRATELRSMLAQRL